MTPFRLKSAPTPADLAPPRCPSTSISLGRCVLPPAHTGDCLHAQQPRCDTPAPSGLHTCRLAQDHAGPHASSPSPGDRARVVWEDPAAAKPSNRLVPHAAIDIGWTRGPLDARLQLQVQPGMDDAERRHLEDRVRDALAAAGLPVRRT